MHSADDAHHRNLTREDQKIELHNQKLNEAHQAAHAARNRVADCQLALSNSMFSCDSVRYSRQEDALQKAERAEMKANAGFAKLVESGQMLAGTGSGKIHILLPASGH